MTTERDEAAIAVDLVGAMVRRLIRRGKAELSRAARSGQRKLEIRQLRKERDHFWIRLGKTAQQLVLAGEIDHPALRKAMARIEEIEAKLERATAIPPLATPEETDYADTARGSERVGV